MSLNQRSSNAQQNARKPLVISIMGPTAAGKTDLAIGLRETLNAEIISVDSAMVYRGLDIGSAKPSRAELALAPHRLIDIREFHQPYSVADFCADATREIEDIISQGRTPLLVGGTMMYFKALLEGLSQMPAADEDVRANIAQEARACGWPSMHAKLAEVDPVSAAKIHPNHSQRLSRALEVFRVSGRPMADFHGQFSGGLGQRYQWLQFAVAPRQRAVLHERIARRFSTMLEQGLIEEVSELRRCVDDRNIVLDDSLPALRAVGYRQVWQFLAGECDHSELELRALAATRQLAKRQLTWLRGWKDLEWLYCDDEKGKSYSFYELNARALKIVSERTI